MKRVSAQQQQSFHCTLIVNKWKSPFVFKRAFCVSFMNMKLSLRLLFVSFFVLSFTIVSCGKKESTVKYSRKGQVGYASWYGERFQGRLMANGKPFNMNKMTAAHRKLPFGTKVKVTNLANQKSVVVTITDRGPFAKNRVLDLSKKAADKLGYLKQGIARIRYQVLD